MRFVIALLILFGPLLGGCASTGANPVADMLLPSDAPPRRGTPAYEVWQAEREAEAARPKGKNAEQK